MARWFLTVTRAILDANMLIVYSIGKKHPEMLGSQKRVKEYMPEDFDLLVQLVEGVDQIYLGKRLRKIRDPLISTTISHM